MGGVLHLDEGRWARAARGPIKQLDGVNEGRGSAALELGHAADIAGDNHVRRDALDIFQLAVAQLAGQFGLKNIVGAGRATAQMALGNIGQRVTGLLKQLARQLIETLAVLQRTRGVIGDFQAGPHHRVS